MPQLNVFLIAILLPVALLAIVFWHWRAMRLHAPSRRARIIGLVGALLWAAAGALRIFSRQWGSTGLQIVIWFVVAQMLLLAFIVPRPKRVVPLACLGISAGFIYFGLHLGDAPWIEARGWERSLPLLVLQAPAVLFTVCFYYVIRFGLAAEPRSEHARPDAASPPPEFLSRRAGGRPFLR